MLYFLWTSEVPIEPILYETGDSYREYPHYKYVLVVYKMPWKDSTVFGVS